MLSLQRRKDDSAKQDWHTRDEMVAHALSLNLLWLGFINIGFAIIILLRNSLFPGYDQNLPASHHTLWAVDGSMLCIIVLALVAILIVKRRRLSLATSKLILAILLCWQGVLWSVCAYQFVAEWQLPFAYPFSVMLMLSAMAALYVFPLTLFLFIVPILGALLLASLHLNQGINSHFLLIWLFFSLILISGSLLLQRWFTMAWQRHSDNQLLISRLEMLAHQDALTGVANRRVLDDYLALMLSQQKPLAVIMLDVDYFKRFNDHYGHPAGDSCLSQIADVLNLSVRTPEDLVARYGGEEFVLLLPEAAMSQAMTVAERIKARLIATAIPHAASDVSSVVTASMGIAVSTGHTPARDLIAAADAALYRAKQAGRNGIAR